MGQNAISDRDRHLRLPVMLWQKAMQWIFSRTVALRIFFADGLAQDGSRFALWSPVILGGGAYWYFSLPAEPNAIGAPLVAALAAMGAFFSHRWRPALIAGAIFLGGFALADSRTARVDAPRIERGMRPQSIIGRLVSVDEGGKGRRLVIAVISMEKITDDDRLPARVRVTWRGKEFSVLPGDVIRVRAALSPPPAPVVPGGYDFGRQLFFDRIGAVGYAVAPPIKMNIPSDHRNRRLWAAVEKVRLRLFRRIIDAAPGEGGAVVAAMITGKRGAIDDFSRARLRDSGLAHLLAISGLHMGLATGIVFFAFRALFATVEKFALYYPIKKWAAAAALCAGFAYLFVSGGGWSARRAFIMTAIIFAAILLDRKAFSLRNVGVAATFILVMWPEAVLHPGFQMSFAAVAALIGAYEWASRRENTNLDYSVPGKIKRYIIGIGVTDIIAATATAPYSLYHFNRAAIYSLPANLIAMPLMAFWIMPIAVLGMFLMPIGIDGFAWRIAAAGVELILSSAGWVAAQKGAIATFAQWPPYVLGALTIGGLWFVVMTAPWRWMGIAAIPIALGMGLGTPRPEIFVDRTGGNVAIYFSEPDLETFAALHPRRDKFAANAWKDSIGLKREDYTTRSLRDYGSCDNRGCTFEMNKAMVAVSLYALSLQDDCTRADLIIAIYPVDYKILDRCAAKVVDMRSAWNDGAHAIEIKSADDIKVLSVSSRRGNRPWSS